MGQINGGSPLTRGDTEVDASWHVQDPPRMLAGLVRVTVNIAEIQAHLGRSAPSAIIQEMGRKS
jgi:hypothetical protein